MVMRYDEPSIFRSSASVVRQHVDAALGLDGRAALAATRRMAEIDLPWLEERAVRLARAEGSGWGRISRVLGRSRQAVWKRYHEVVETPMPPPLRPTTVDERVMRLYRGGQAETRRKREFDEIDPSDVVPW